MEIFTVNHELFIAASYLLLGGGIKYIDQAYDIGVFSKATANMIAVLCGVIMAYLVITDATSTAIFLAMILSLALTRKIDNIAFYLGTALVLLLPVLFDGTLNVLWLPFGVLTVSGVIDELGNDWADKRKNKQLVNIKIKNGDSSLYKLAEHFFTHRFSMKVAIFLLVVASFFEPIYLIAFLLFDAMYLIVEMYSMQRKVYSLNKAAISVEG